jgi:hypothetical protein
MDPSSTCSSVAELQAATQALTAAAKTLEGAAGQLLADVISMQSRSANAVSRTRDASADIVTALARSQAVVLSRARARLRMVADKVLVKRCEEADANTRLLDAVASMRAVRQLSALFVHDVNSLPLAF